jgi:hypothetical protein
VNSVFGFSVLYTLARLRPIDITWPIWPDARRLIHTRNPMMSTNGRA